MYWLKERRWEKAKDIGENKKEDTRINQSGWNYFVAVWL